MAREQTPRRRSRIAVCREWLGWALLAIAIVCLWVFLGRLAYHGIKALF